MNITLRLDPEVEENLLARARERGLTVDAYLEILVRAEARVASARRSGKEKARAFKEWAKGHRPTKLLSDEAVSRAAQYPDRL